MNKQVSIDTKRMIEGGASAKDAAAKARERDAARKHKAPPKEKKGK